MKLKKQLPWVVKYVLIYPHLLGIILLIILFMMSLFPLEASAISTQPLQGNTSAAEASIPPPSYNVIRVTSYYSIDALLTNIVRKTFLDVINDARRMETRRSEGLRFKFATLDKRDAKP